jgi:hypothetical protein
MSTTVPDTPALLQAAADYLEGELLPTLPDYHRFQTRVTVNLLRLVERELRLAPAQQRETLQIHNPAWTRDEAAPTFLRRTP